VPLGDPVKVGLGVVVIAGAVKVGLGVVVTEVAPGDTVPVTRGVPVVCGVPETIVPVGAGTGGVGVVTG
jgi:hypothetical protein